MASSICGTPQHDGNVGMFGAVPMPSTRTAAVGGRASREFLAFNPTMQKRTLPSEDLLWRRQLTDPVRVVRAKLFPQSADNHKAYRGRQPASRCIGSSVLHPLSPS